MRRTLDHIAAVVPDCQIAFPAGAQPDRDIVLSGIVTDSRDVNPGDLFFAMPGTRADGRTFIADAVSRGAVATVVGAQANGASVPQLVVHDVREALARIADEWYGVPGSDVDLVGVTGTNGKTTSVRLIAGMMTTNGRCAASLGTLGATLDGRPVDLGLSRPTTPEAHELRPALRTLAEQGARTIAMEVSSHATALKRVWGLNFRVAVFTNLTEDHLDFHGDLDAYFRAKAMLFESLDESATAVINIDDPRGRELMAMTQARVLTFGWDNDADIRPVEIRSEGPISVALTSPVGPIELEMPFVGRFNIANAMATVGTGIALKLAPTEIAAGLASAELIPGRFEPVDAGQDFTVVVDYAHTPDALDNALRTARGIAEGRDGRLICVVGCGGDRDRTKRPIMGGIAAKLADTTIFTSDNPRTEIPERILDEIVAGASGFNPFERMENRRAAIRRAIEKAQPGDVVVIAGKGHEPYQEINGIKHHFDDREEAREALGSTHPAER